MRFTIRSMKLQSARDGRFRRFVLFPRRRFWKAGLEGLLELFLVIACVLAGKEFIEGLIVEPLPGDFFRSRVDRVEEGTIGFGRFAIAGSVADHEDLFVGILLFSRHVQVLDFRSPLLPGDDGYELADSVFFPLPLEGIDGRLGNAHSISRLIDYLQRFPNHWEGGHTVDNILDGGIDGIGPGLYRSEAFVSTRDFRVQGCVPEF